ncbi:MAG: ComF family protein [Rhodobiaceae bacterium]|nr:ComF family protein [Rhodobiaceae bacterium]
MGAAASFALDFLLPPACPVCRARCDRNGALCAECWNGLDFLTPPWCDVLGTPLPYDPGVPTISPAATADPPPWQRARAAVIYGERAARLVSALKYRDRMEVARPMAAMMARAGAELLADCDLIIPIPLHYRRLWARRFNQSGELARHLKHLSGKPGVNDALIRLRPTRRQVGLNATARARNVAGAFRVAPDRTADVSGRRVLLVDDVLTTGATLRAAARALRRAGAIVDVLTFAMVVEDA